MRRGEAVFGRDLVLQMMPFLAIEAPGPSTRARRARPRSVGAGPEKCSRVEEFWLLSQSERCLKRGIVLCLQLRYRIVIVDLRKAAEDGFGEPRLLRSSESKVGKNTGILPQASSRSSR